MPATAPVSRNGAMASFSISTIVKQSKPLPDRIVIYAPAKWGKTSFVAQFPDPIFLTTRGEDGLQKLIESGQLQPTPHFPCTACSWNDVMLAISTLTVEETPYKTFVLDTANGAEQLGHERTCEKHYQNDWSERGFNSFGAGEKISTRECWQPLLERLDALRESRKMRIVLCCHNDTRNQKNPGGLDYPKSQPALSNTAWKLTSKWADMILFGDFETTVAKEDPKNKISKAKATEGTQRMLYCQPRAYFEAGNRHGLPEEIDCGNSPQEAWANFRAAFVKKVIPQT
jgi:hypothetical protein